MPAGAPKGNQNARRAKDFETALRRALAVDDWKQLREGCKQVAAAFAAGQPWAAQFVADRLDGKPDQTFSLHTPAQELSDDELSRIATTSSNRIIEATASKEISTEFH